MATNTMNAAAGEFSARPAFRGLAAVGRAIGSVVKTVQVARMMQVLATIDQQQLADLGIERSDIPAYAEWLVYGGKGEFKPAHAQQA